MRRLKYASYIRQSKVHQYNQNSDVHVTLTSACVINTCTFLEHHIVTMKTSEFVETEKHPYNHNCNVFTILKVTSGQYKTATSVEQSIAINTAIVTVTAVLKKNLLS